MNSIIDILKSKGVEIAASFIPGGTLVQSLVKSVATSLVGNENASEEEVKIALENADIEQINKIKSEIEKLTIELSINQEKSIQEKEKSNQEESITKRRAFDFIERLIGKNPVLSIVIYSVVFYAVLIGILSYAEYAKMENIEVIELVIICLGIIYITFPIAIIYQPMYKIIDALSDLAVGILRIRIKITSKDEK